MVEIESTQDLSHLFDHLEQATLFNDRWLVQQIPAPAFSVVDFAPDHDDPDVSEVEYGFKTSSGAVAMFDAVVIHRHANHTAADDSYGRGNPHGACEHAKASEHADNIPAFVEHVVTRLMDMPLARPNGDNEE